MANVHVDPQTLREFASRLQRFSEFLTKQMTQTQGRMGQLGESWKDAEFQAFRDTFARTSPLIRQFAEEAGQTVPKLIGDAEAIEEYQRLKPE